MERRHADLLVVCAVRGHLTAFAEKMKLLALFQFSMT